MLKGERYCNREFLGELDRPGAALGLVFVRDGSNRSRRIGLKHINRYSGFLRGRRDGFSDSELGSNSDEGRE
jgi:hypothetical protein